MRSIDEALGLPVAPSREKSEVSVPPSREGDGEVARLNLLAMITEARDAVRDMGEIAWTSQSSRAYEVLGQLIEKGIHASRELVELERNRRELEGGAGPKTVNNTLVLTGEQALDLVKKKLGA